MFKRLKKILAFLWLAAYDHEDQITYHREIAFPTHSPLDTETLQENRDIILASVLGSNPTPINEWMSVCLVRSPEEEPVPKKKRELNFWWNFIGDRAHILTFSEKLKNRRFVIAYDDYYENWYSRFHSDTTNILDRVKRMDKQERQKNFMETFWETCSKVAQETR